ncbi:MAG: hypothetical protein NT129_05890 [Candidatus Aenigmarchaeota archaeon]|nr:hypothetical protein [Candidatus Aenigmarchaeota archaeon]
MRCNKFILIIGFLFCFVQLALAGSISITVTATTSVFEDNGVVNITLQNNGDEAAEDVRVSLLLPEDFTSDMVVIGRLFPGVPWSGAIFVNTTDNLLPGAYPAVILTQYRDANGYPFSSVSKNSIVYKEISSSDVSGMINDNKKVELYDNVNIFITLLNQGNSAIDAKVRLYLPREIKAEEYEKNISLDAKGKKDINFKISNFGALSGSSYFVLSAIEYDGDKHYTSFASGIVEIKEKSEIAGLETSWLIFLLIALIIIFILYQFKGRIRWKKNTK